jgi:hypothetical protein
MKEFYEYIKEQLQERITETQVIEGVPTVVPVFKTIQMFNNQFEHSNKPLGAMNSAFGGRRDEKAFRYPACFIEIIVNEVRNLPLGIKDYLLTVRFRFGRESYKYERLETFDFCDNFYAAIQGLAPNSNDLCFTTFIEANTEFDENHNNVENPYVDYTTRYRSQVAYYRRTDELHGPITPVATGDIVTLDDL